jgi:hypothetical protein
MKRFITPLLTMVVVSVILAGCAPTAQPEAPEESAPTVTNTPPPASSEPSVPEMSEPPEPASTPPVALPKPGEWTASTGASEFTFTFTVGPDSTDIPKYSIRFTEFKCGGVQVSGGWEATVLPKPPITDGQFTIETEERGFGTTAYTWDIVVQGEFDRKATQASGTWEIASEGTTCQEGAWEASAP